MNFQTLHHLYNERLPEIENIIDMESNGNADLRREGLLGAYQALQTDPNASKRFLLNKATPDIRYKTMDGLPDVSMRKRLQITFPQLYEMKRNIRVQIKAAFAA